MRRITSACLLQTLRFEANNELTPEQEFEIYCKRLEQKHILYVIEEKTEHSDGTIFVKIKKQYNTYPTTGYIN